MVGIRPVTPGTLVVFVGTILLVLVSVSVPLWKSIYFLESTVSASIGSTSVNGDIKLGVWGYCVGDTCSNATLGYQLDVDNLFGISGIAASSGLPTTLIKWLTYALILHPIAAVLAAVGTVCGLLAHIRELSFVACLSTTFASFSATVALIAFIFDIALFTIAKNRINSAGVGGTASYGNAIWMTLAAALLLMFSGCFFGCGACLIRNRRPAREASEKSKPLVDQNYGNQMRNDALDRTNNNSSYGHGEKGRSEGGLPMFADRDGEIIPLTSLRASDEEEDGYGPAPRRAPSVPRTDTGSHISGVGEGYGRRTGGMPISMSEQTALSGGGGSTLAGGAAAGLAASAAAARGHQYTTSGSTPGRQGSTPHIEPFTGMTPQQPAPSPAISQASGYQNYNNYNNNFTSMPSTPTPMPMPAPIASSSMPTTPYRTNTNPSVGEYYTPNTGTPTPNTSQGYANEKANYFAAQSQTPASQAPYVSSLPASSSQQYYVQNQSTGDYPHSSSPPPMSFNSHLGPAPSYQTHIPTGSTGNYGDQQHQNYDYGHAQDNSIVYHPVENQSYGEHVPHGGQHGQGQYGAEQHQYGYDNQQQRY